MAVKKYLDQDGLSHFWSVIKDKLDGKKIYYGTCTTAASAAAKVVDCDGFKLETGAHITVRFKNSTTYNGPTTLNVNNTGAVPIQRVGGNVTIRYWWNTGEVIDFVYDGTAYIMARSGQASTTYYGLTKLSESVISTSTGTAPTNSALNSAMQYMVGYAPYSAATTYAVGDRCRYGYYVYECNTAITVAEAWTAAHWTALQPIWEKLDDIDNAIGDVETILAKLNTGTGASS